MAQTQQTMDPILTKVQQQTGAKVPPALQPTYQRIIVAGHKVMYSPQSHRLMVQQMSQGQPANAVGDGIAKLLAILLHESRGTLNMKAAIPAMSYLMCDALDFMEKAGKVQVSDDLVSATTKEMGSSILQILGVNQQKLQGMVNAGPQGQPGAAQPAMAQQAAAQQARPQQAPAAAPRGIINGGAQ